MHQPDVVIAPPEVLALLLAARSASVCTRAVDARGHASIALTGGSAFRALGGSLAAALPWDAIDVFWSDERAVPPGHPDSNYRLACEVVLERSPIPSHRIHRMPADDADLDSAAVQYAGTLERVIGSGAGLDLVVLGLGADGHVCSLFPGHAALDVRDRAVTAVYDSPKPPPRRLTLTLPTIESAAQVIVLALGPEKRTAVRAALESPSSPLPVARVVRAAASVLFLLDPEAAALLEW